MTKQELLSLLHELGVHPSRRLGQNFLVDANLLGAIVRTARPRAGERILEVGPGTGILTRELLAAGCHVTAVELDRRLAAFLTREFGGNPRFHLISGDACRQDYGQLFPGGGFRCVANLPYSCSSAFLGTLFALPHPPSECYFLLQKDMADRLCTGPGSKAYGALTVRCALAYDVRIERRIPPAVFYPVPGVESALVSLHAHGLVSCEIRQRAAEIVRLVFGQRRKKARRLLEARFGSVAVDRAFGELSIPEGARAEQLPVEVFRGLTTCLLPLEAGY